MRTVSECLCVELSTSIYQQQDTLRSFSGVEIFSASIENSRLSVNLFIQALISEIVKLFVYFNGAYMFVHLLMDEFLRNFSFFIKVNYIYHTFRSISPPCTPSW